MLKGTKTPVSFLQEYLLKQHKCPQYELIFDGTGTPNPKFTFRVQAGDLSEEGTGKNKQEAKHKAAENMLKAMGLIKNEPKDDEEKENEDSLDPTAVNYVGALKEFCFVHGYPNPQYDVEETAGPPHSRVFKMVCWVSNIREDGVAKTKKGAKQIAAAKMLQQLQQCVNEAPAVKEIIKIPEVTLTKEEISEKYKNVKFSTSQNVQNPLAFYKDNHNAYLKLHEESPTLRTLIKSHAIDYNNSVSLLEDIAKELNVKLSTFTDLKTKKEKEELLFVTMGLTPSISEVGVNYKDATCKLLKTLLILAR